MENLPPKNNFENYSSVPLANNQVLLDGNGNLVQDNDQETNLDELPIGYRFLPTDQELVCAYLLPRINDETLPPNMFHEVDVYQHTPDYLTETYRPQGENEWYFFTKRNRKYGNGGRPGRGVEGSGYWKATGIKKNVMIGEKNVGVKRTLVYYEKEDDNIVTKHPWSMKEYLAVGTSIPANGKNMTLDRCVLCKICKNNSHKHNHGNKDPAQEESLPQDQAQAQMKMPFIGSSFSMYNQYHEFNNMSLRQVHNMGNENCYNNHIPYTNVDASSLTTHFCTSSDLLSNTTQNPYANLDYGSPFRDNFCHENGLTVTDQSLLDMKAIEEGGPSNEGYDFADSCFADFPGASPPPDGKAE